MSFPDSRRLKSVLDRTLAWSRAQDYLEYTKHDALNSPLLKAMFGFGRLPRIFATQAVMRFPVNLRPLLGVARSANPKGYALFVMALLDDYETTGSTASLQEAERLLVLLMELRSQGRWHGDCWGYQYPWQDLGFYAPSGTPNAVVTAFVCEAFLHAHAVTGRREYLDTVVSARRFFLQDLTVLKETDDEKCVAYMPLDMKMRVMDVSVLIASVLARLQQLGVDPDNGKEARRLCQFVINRQTQEGAWFYTDPPEDSPVKVDNYHTGFILDAIKRTSERLTTAEWLPHYDRGLAFYARHLFNADGSPRWMSDRDYPHDIHGAAQGILTFSQPENRLRYPGLADRIAAWALGNMYHADGRFYYQQTRLYTKRTTFLRWCNAWMCRAIASKLKSDGHEKN